MLIWSKFSKRLSLESPSTFIDQTDDDPVGVSASEFQNIFNLHYRFVRRYGEG